MILVRDLVTSTVFSLPGKYRQNVDHSLHSFNLISTFSNLNYWKATSNDILLTPSWHYWLTTTKPGCAFLYPNSKDFNTLIHSSDALIKKKNGLRFVCPPTQKKKVQNDVTDLRITSFRRTLIFHNVSWGQIWPLWKSQRATCFPAPKTHLAFCYVSHCERVSKHHYPRLTRFV